MVCLWFGEYKIPPLQTQFKFILAHRVHDVFHSIFPSFSNVSFFFARHFLGTSTPIVLSGTIYSIQSLPAMSASCLWIGMEKAALGSGSRSMAVLTVSNVLWKLVDFCHLHLISNFIILNYFSCFL